MAQILRIDWKNGGLKPVQDADLKTGQIIWLNGYGQNDRFHDRLVVYLRKLSTYDQRVQYDLVDVDKLHLRTVNAYEVRPVSELFGIGLYYTPGDIFEDVDSLPALVEKARGNMEAEKILAETQKQIEAEEGKKLRERLLFENPTLERLQGSKLSSHALGAKNIRTQLKAAFPGVKFSVRSESYSGGDSIDVHWDLGPSTKDVDEIADRYQECSFDGMQDLETYRETQWPGLFGGAKYVSCHRGVDEQNAGGAWDVVARALCDIYRLPVPADRGYWRVNIDTAARDVGNAARVLLCAYSYPVGAIITGVERTEETAGQWEEMYRPTFTAPETKKPEQPQPEATPAQTTAEGVTVRRNEDKNGIEILFPSKPTPETIQRLKSSGFRWSPANRLWYTHYTPEAMATAQTFGRV